MPRRPPSMRMFTIPDHAGVTVLPFGEDHGLCARCEGRPASVEVHRPTDAEVRRLCIKCVFEEVAATQPTATEVAESEERRLAEAEATASPAELGQMAEFLEEWWDAQDDAPPEFVAGFIARHLGSAPRPAVPVFEGPVADGDLQAARFALLVMRGALCERHEVAADEYLIEPDTTPMSRERAAELLARMPKPLECRARIHGGIMRVRCRTISEPARLHGREENASYWSERGGHFPHLRQAYGERYAELPIYCLGCGESLLLPASAVERWHRDYEVSPMGFGASPPSAYLSRDPAGARAAVAAGAAYLVKCSSGPDEQAADVEGRIIELRDPATWDEPTVYALTPDLDRICERCVERAAAWLATDTRTKPWLERRLCDVCTAAELAPRSLDEAREFERGVSELSEKGRRSVAEDIAGALEVMERRWKLLPMPVEVAAALERCRRV